MKVKELRRLIEEKKLEARQLLKDDKLKEAEDITAEIRKLERKVQIAEEIEEDEKRDLENQREQRKNKEEINEFRSLTKLIIGKDLSQEERAVIKSTDVGTVIPKEYVNKIEEVRKGFAPLKELCDVIPVTKAEGTIPVVDLDQNEMQDLVEGDDIADGSLVTTEISYKVSSVGLIDKFSFESVEDAEVSLEELATKNFSEIAVRKENKRIINAINTKATLSASTATDLQDILEEEMASVVPTAAAGLVTLVNTKAYVYLKNKKDKEGRNLNLITIVGGKEYFNNKPIERIDDAVAPVLSEGKTMLAYTANMKEAVKFIDRKQITIARAEKFESGAKMVRVLERIDVKVGTARSIKKIELA
jgi:HK97 family phage major capsid protein